MSGADLGERSQVVHAVEGGRGCVGVQRCSALSGNAVRCCTFAMPGTRQAVSCTDSDGVPVLAFAMRYPALAQRWAVTSTACAVPRVCCAGSRTDTVRCAAPRSAMRTVEGV
eukprot:3487153-Rhodomonas_salina.1